MPKLENVSNYLTEKHFQEVMDLLKERGVNLKEGKLVGYRTFTSARGQYKLQIVFLNISLPDTVTEVLSKYGLNLRHEFKASNSHAHTTLLTDKEYRLLTKEEKRLVREMEETRVEVLIKGIIALSNSEDVCLGLDVEVPGLDDFRKNIHNFKPILNPHITTSHMWLVVMNTLNTLNTLNSLNTFITLSTLSTLITLSL